MAPSEDAPGPRFFAYPEEVAATFNSSRISPEQLRIAGRSRVFVGNVFPNFSFLNSMHTIRVWHPRGPDKLEVWAWGLVPRAAPPEVREAWRLSISRTFSVAGVFEQDDGENWSQIQQVLRGRMARATRFNVAMARGHLVPDAARSGFAGKIAPIFSEEGARAFYGAWQRMISGASWDDLLGVSEGPAGSRPSETVA